MVETAVRCINCNSKDVSKYGKQVAFLDVNVKVMEKYFKQSM